MSVRRTGSVFYAAVVFLALSAAPATALTITFTNGAFDPQFRQVFRPTLPSPDQFAALSNIFNAAASYWEARIADNMNFRVAIGFFGAGALPSNVLGATIGQGTVGFIGVSPLSRTNWFMDPTPELNEEFLTETLTFADLGGGRINVGDAFTGGPEQFDLLTTAIHELGHVLTGPLFGTGNLLVTSPRPAAGTELPFSESHLLLPVAVMFPFDDGNGRRLLSDADVLFAAQAGHFSQVSLAERDQGVPVAEPASLALLITGLSAGVLSRRRPWSVVRYARACAM